jgi:hypothetical protein
MSKTANDAHRTYSPTREVWVADSEPTSLRVEPRIEMSGELDSCFNTAEKWPLRSPPFHRESDVVEQAGEIYNLFSILSHKGQLQVTL